MKKFLKRHRKGLIVLVVIVSLVVAGGAYIRRQVENLQEVLTSQYATTELEKKTIINSININGTIASDERKDVAIPLSNIEIQQLQIKVGDIVTQGDILGVFDATDIQKNLDDAKQSLYIASTQTNNSISSAKDSLDNVVESAEINNARAQDNLDAAYFDFAAAGADEAAAKTEYDTAIAETNAAKAAYDQAVNGTAVAQRAYYDAMIAAGVNLETFNTNLAAVKAADVVAPLLYPWDTVTITTSLVGLPVAPAINTIADLSDPLVQPWAEGKTTVALALVARDALVSAITTLVASQVSQATYDTAIANVSVTSAQALLTAAETKEASLLADYTTKKATSDQKKSIYDSATSVREAKADVYNNAALTLKDTIRSNETTVDAQESSLDSTKLNSTNATVTQENQVKMYEEQLDATTIYAPFSGTITAINYDEGDTYNGGVLYTIQDCEALIITASVDQYDISDIKTGMRAVFKTDTTGDEEMIGTVTFVSPVPESSSLSGGTFYPIEITIENPNERLRLGMSAQVNIVLEEAESVFAVPYESVRTDVDGNTYINVIVEATEEEAAENGTNTAASVLTQNTKKIYVEVGLETSYYTEIRSDELEEGMIVQLTYYDNTLLESMTGLSGQ